MLRWRRLSLLVAVATLVGAVGAAPTGPVSGAFAQDQDCWRWVRVVTGQDENGDPLYGWQLRNTCGGSGGGSGGGGGANTCQHPEHGPFDCYNSTRGWWSNARDCYAKQMSPQPAEGDPLWGGHSPDEGAVYVFSCPRGPQTDDDYDEEFLFLTEAPGVPSPAELAQEAMERLPLVGADIGIAPSPDGVGLVGVHVWLWTENTADTWGPVSVSVPGPGITVTAQGQATRILWDMGDGTVVECDTPGEPYLPEYGSREPECGHIYQYPSLNLPDGRYQITATTDWQVNWWVEPQGDGATGSQGFTRESSTSVEIHELQVVTS